MSTKQCYLVFTAVVAVYLSLSSFSPLHHHHPLPSMMVHGAIQHTMSGQAYGDYDHTMIFNKWVGLNLPLIQIYDNFCGFWVMQDLTPQWNQRGVLMFTFQPIQINCVQKDTGNTAELVASGATDAYLNSFFNQTKTWLAGPNGIYGDGDDRRMYMRFAHEMNGNWYPWSGNATAYVLMWRRVYVLATNKWGIDKTRMQWVWCVNGNDVGGIKRRRLLSG
eukprot:TRINITY_DN5903_c0_g1_i1.p1 TRINITY_DN5903_c0_g1~~TRINITY_DN5903_c0_g1_i1.p1  ORF type:complete len:220 (+),score=15.89 TRINITY_DN5903_c0_g1_i1:109-768(+)